MADRAIRSAIEQALNSVAGSAEAQLSALEHCLQQTSAHLPTDGSAWAPTSDEDWWLILRRLQTLQHLDRLQTALAICQGKFSGDVFSAVRDADISKIAAEFASVANLLALTTLIERHPYSLLPGCLDLLSRVPETVLAKSFTPVLRLVVSLHSPPAPLRDADWVENEAMCVALRRRGEQHHVLLCTEHMAKLNLGWAPPSEAAVAGWALKRALAIDGSTGQLYSAMELLDVARAALHYGPAGQPLAELHRAAEGLSTLVQLAAWRGEEGWQMELGTFSALDSVAKLRLLFKHLDSDDLATDIQRVVVPFASGLLDQQQHHQQQHQNHDYQGREDQSTIISRALEAEAQERLQWVSKFISAEAHRPTALETHADVVRAACAATYASASTEAWALQEALLTSAQEAIVSSSSGRISRGSGRDASDGALQAEVLRNIVLQARGHLTAARVLTRYGLPTTMAEVRDVDHDTAITLIRTLLARVARGHPAESRWGDLWNDLRMAQEEGLQILPLSEVREEVCRALLGCGQLRPAQKHLDQLDPARQEALVLEAARDVFYSEGAPDAAAVKRAKQVLSALPSSEAAREEASFIDAAARLQALGVDMPPLQLRQAPDKARVLRHALENAPPKALRDVDGLVALSEALGTELARGQVLAMVADVALFGTQLKLAEGVAMQLASEHSQYGWQVAARLALEEPCSTESIRRTLLAYAMRFAPREELEGQLHCWQASDAGAAGTAAVWTVPEAPADVAELYPCTAEVPLSDFLAGGGSAGRGAPEDNGVLLLSCLLALGPVRQVEWARQLEEHKASLSSEALRQGHIVGIEAAAIAALTPESTTDEGQEPRDESNKDISPLDLLSSTPREILLMALDSSASTTTTGKSEELTTLLHSLCQHLVAAADAQSVARLLPGQQGLEGDAASQRAVVLQLASAAGRGGVPKGDTRGRIIASFDDVTASEEGSPRESGDGGKNRSDIDNGTHPAADASTSLQHVLALAERYDVEAWEVYTAYIVAALRDIASHEHIVQTRLNAAWPLLLETHPIEAVSALVNDVFPFIENISRLEMMLRMCAECCRGIRKEGAMGEEEGCQQAATALESVSTAAEALDKNVAGLDMKTLIKPLLYSMMQWLKLESKVCVVTPGEVQAAVHAGVVECQNIQHVALLAQGIDAIAAQHAALTAATFSSKESVKPHNIAHPYPASYPATGSTVYVAAACRELASLALAEGVDAQQRHRLQQCFNGMVARDIVAVAGFACLGNSPPLLDEAISSDTSVLLSSDQSLAVLEEAVAVMDASDIGGAANSSQEEVGSKVDILRKERVRLATMQQIYTTCQLSESQAKAVESVVVELQSLKPEESGEAGVILLTRQLDELFTSGCCVVPSISGVADALLPITPQSDAQLDTPSALAKGASTAVNEALQTLAGTGGNGLSIGDAIQSLYGVLRSLDVSLQIGDQKDQESALASATPVVETLRIGVWSQLEHHAATCDPENNAAAAEAHLQVLQMLGSLGSNMWKGWKPPAGAPTSAFKHAEALLHSRVAATLASAWPGVLQEAAVTVQEFASVEGAEAAILRVISCAQNVDQFQAVLTVLTDVLLDAFPTQEGDSLDSLHRCWSACLSGLLSHGAIDLVLSAADVLHFRRPPLLPALSHTEAEALVEAADVAGGIAARVALALLTPYESLRAAGWALLLALPHSDDISGLPGATALAIVALQQERLAELARQSPATLRRLLSSTLQSTSPAMCSDLVGGQHTNISSGMPLRSALAAAAAAHLVGAGEFKAASWVAMEHSGLQPLLRVLDSALAALNGLLRAGARASALENVDIEAESAAAVVAARSAEAVVRGVPLAAAQALEHCDL